MSSLKILYNNAADRATLTATSSALPFTALQSDSKSEVWRSAAGVTTASLTASWAALEPISCIALPFCNLSVTATMRVRLYSDTAGTALVLDTGATLCAEGLPMALYGMNAAQASSAYSYGGGTVGRLFFDKVMARKVVIDIVDTASLQGYIEAARLVVGDCFTTKYNASYGAEIVFEDNSQNTRSEAGNLISDVGCRYKKLKLDLEILSPAERAALWKLVAYVGTTVPVFMSVLSEDDDKQAELDYTVYGKFTSMSAISARSYLIYSTPLELESV